MEILLLFNIIFFIITILSFTTGRHIFSKRERIRYVCYMPSQIRLSSVCLSVTLVRPTQPVEIFGNFFSPYDSPGTLVF